MFDTDEDTTITVRNGILRARERRKAEDIDAVTGGSEGIDPGDVCSKAGEAVSNEEVLHGEQSEVEADMGQKAGTDGDETASNDE